MNLKSFVRPNLDVLFVALNPAGQSHENGHYLSGSHSRFYKLLTQSGLLTEPVDRLVADEIVFGGTALNYQNRSSGVIDLVPDLVETNSRFVRTNREHASALLRQVRTCSPRFLCVIHRKVMRTLDRYPTWLRACPPPYLAAGPATAAALSLQTALGNLGV